MLVFSESGILERTEINKKMKNLLLNTLELKKTNAKLDRLYHQYKDGLVADTDLFRWGYLPNEKRLYYIEDEHTLSKVENVKQTKKPFKVEISHFRIIWVVISVLIMLLYYSKMSDIKDE